MDEIFKELLLDKDQYLALLRQVDLDTLPMEVVDAIQQLVPTVGDGWEI